MNMTKIKDSIKENKLSVFFLVVALVAIIYGYFYTLSIENEANAYKSNLATTCLAEIKNISSRCNVALADCKRTIEDEKAFKTQNMTNDCVFVEASEEEIAAFSEQRPEFLRYGFVELDVGNVGTYFRQPTADKEGNARKNWIYCR